MLNDRDFILVVQQHPELYSNKNIYEVHSQIEQWAQIAQETGLKNALLAKHKWREITCKYVAYLIYGAPFALAQEMQFMQAPLLLARTHESADADADADLELDEVELTRIINSDDEVDFSLLPPSITDQQHAEKCARLTPHLSKQKKESPHEVVKGAIGQTNVKKDDQNNLELSNSLISNAAPHETFISASNLTMTNNTMNILHEDNSKMALSSAISTKSTATTISTEPKVPTIGCGSGNFSNLTSLELIFLGYAKVLERMPLPLQLQTKRKIADIMDEIELKMFDKN